jgi:hypothetical protein
MSTDQHDDYLPERPGILPFQIARDQQWLRRLPGDNGKPHRLCWFSGQV